MHQPSEGIGSITSIYAPSLEFPENPPPPFFFFLQGIWILSYSLVPGETWL